MNTVAAVGRCTAVRCKAGLWGAGALAVSALLSACGGGGGSSGSAAPPTATISLAPTTVPAGQNSVLSWSASGASSCTASGAWSGTVATSGTLNVSQPVPGSYSYAITCNSTGGSVAGSATLTVTAPAPVVSISVAPSSVSTNHTATLSWSASNATNCQASGAWGGAQYPSGSITVGQQTPGSYTYTLACTDGAVSASKSATLTVVNPQQLATTLTANPTATAVGQSTTLTWSSTGADSCIASGGWSGTLAASGSQVVTVSNAGANNYYLQCSSGTGDGSAQATVQGLVATVSLSANPTTVGPGQTTTLSWSSTQATSCTASGEWSGTLASAGSKVVTPGSSLGSHTYSLSCGNPGAPAQASVVVTTAAPTATLSVFPSTVVAGKTVTLRWQGQNADSCVASGDWSGTLGASGFKTLTMSSAGTENFHLACSSSGASSGAASASVTVSAAPAFPAATTYRVTESHDGVIATTDGSTVPASAAPSWSVDFGAPVSYPLIAGGMVFVATDNSNQSYGNQLYGLDAKTGAKLWGPVAVSGVYFGSGITYDNGRVFLLMFDGGLHAFNASNGAALWTAQLPGYWYDGMPNAYGGTVFVLGNGGLSAVDESSGNILWTDTSVDATDWVSPAVSSEGVYYQDGYSCLAGADEPLKGTLIWQNPHPACNTPWGYTPVISGSTFFGRTTGALNLFDAASGTAEGQLGSGYGPAITATAVIALNSGTLSSTRRSDLVQTWTFTGDGRLLTAPLVVNNTVFVGSGSGNVYGLDVASGAQTWLGVSPLGINQDSENGGPMPPSGPAVGEGLLIYPAGNSLVAWKFH